MKARKKSVVIEAFKLGIDYIPDWFRDGVTANKIILHGEYGSTNADIETLEGWHHANHGDYIIRGVNSEIYPCKPDIFTMTYDVEPFADKAPVVHARWIGVRDGCGICSNCNRQDGVDPLATHCRYCGAKINLEE